MTPTAEQQRVCDFITTGTGNATVTACAGGAKTTTLVMVAALLPKGRLNLCFAFNTDIAKTLESRMPYWVTASTWHRHFNAALGRHLGTAPRIHGRKCADILKTLVPEYKIRRDIEDDVLALVSRAKAFGYGCGLAEDVSLTDLADRFGLDASVSLVEDILERSARDLTVVDFDDMLWLTLKLGVACGSPDFVLVDEAQDTNVVQRALLRRMLTCSQCKGKGDYTCVDDLVHHCSVCSGTGLRGRLLAVGDPHQSIYGFRGADADAMAALARDFDCASLPLSVSWRCSRSVVAEAQKHL